ncbi:DgyrCDS13562 [Dimorphilus gyrociliatus]|uniref:DgyrCDS13562 n=1 Tax=Dimorphilus gyrociliatus TaxID=2664684 RepID=A0A7I8WAZ6_9ANNE|nr:DgyrCDS13562 [Dimorphilus gyrociliatus]
MKNILYKKKTIMNYIYLVQRVFILFGSMLCQIGKMLGFDNVSYEKYLNTLRSREEKIVLLESRVSELTLVMAAEKSEQYVANQQKNEEIDELRKNLQNLMDTVDFFKSSENQSCMVQTTNKRVVKIIQNRIREIRDLLVRDISLLEDNTWYEVRDRGENIEGRLRDFRHSLEENNLNPQLVQTLKDMELLTNIRNNRYDLVNNLIGNTVIHLQEILVLSQTTDNWSQCRLNPISCY